MDSVLYTFRSFNPDRSIPSNNCSAPIQAFQSVATGTCLSNPQKHVSYSVACPAPGSQFSQTTYQNNLACSSTGVITPYTSTCPAVGFDYRRLLLESNESSSNYSATNTNSATQNYAAYFFYICSNTLTISVCDYSYSGDTYLRLYLGATLLLASDDYCSLGSQFSYTFSSCGSKYSFLFYNTMS